MAQYIMSVSHISDIVDAVCHTVDSWLHCKIADTSYDTIYGSTPVRENGIGQ